MLIMNKQTLPAVLSALGLSLASSQAATLMSGYTNGTGSQLLVANGGAGTTLFNDSADLGGTDVNGTTSPFFSVLFNGSSNWAIGDTVSITGVAMALVDGPTATGTFTFDIRQGAGGTGTAETVGLASLGTADAAYTSGSGTSTYYVNFDTPITFVADANSTSIVVNWGSTAAIRWKKEANPGPGRLPQVNYGNGNFVGGDDSVRFTIMGSVTPVPEPSVMLLSGLGVLGLLRRRRA